MLNNETSSVDECRGYPLFTEADAPLRARNRGVVMANITEEHRRDGKVSAKGLAITLDYFQHIPALERKAALEAYREVCQKRGMLNAA